MFPGVLGCRPGDHLSAECCGQCQVVVVVVVVVVEVEVVVGAVADRDRKPS